MTRSAALVVKRPHKIVILGAIASLTALGVILLGALLLAVGL